MFPKIVTSAFPELSFSIYQDFIWRLTGSRNLKTLSTAVDRLTGCFNVHGKKMFSIS